MSSFEDLVDEVNHPPHYKQHPSGIECIQITEHFNFNMGNAIKYIWRTDEKDDPIQNLKKAAWYIEREISRRGRDQQETGKITSETRGNLRKTT